MRLSGFFRSNLARFAAWLHLTVALVALATLAGLVAAFSPDFPLPVTAAQAAPMRVSTIAIRTVDGDHPLTVEWAVTGAEQEQGLMYRRKMADDAGMIFDFGDDDIRVFWMKNTYLPLDMLFVDSSGTVRHIITGARPFSEERLPSQARVRYVVEVNAGTVEKWSIDVGDRVMFRSGN